MGFTNRNRGKTIYAWLWARLFVRSTFGPLTARAGGGRALATALSYGINRVAVSATAADSVQLPSWVQGAEVLVINDGVASTQVFGKNGTTDTIDGIATGTGVPLAAATRCWYYAGDVAGAWLSVKGTKSS